MAVNPEAVFLCWFLPLAAVFFESAALTERSLYFPVSVNCSSAPNKASFYSNKGSDAYDLIQQHGLSFPCVHILLHLWHLACQEEHHRPWKGVFRIN